MTVVGFFPANFWNLKAFGMTGALTMEDCGKETERLNIC